MNDQQVRLNAILDWLSKGQISTEQAAARVARMHFTAPPDKTPAQEMEAAAIGDGDVPEPGSPFAISDALVQGKIDKAQYAALAKAAAQATDKPG